MGMGRALRTCRTSAAFLALLSLSPPSFVVAQAGYGLTDAPNATFVSPAVGGATYAIANGWTVAWTATGAFAQERLADEVALVNAAGTCGRVTYQRAAKWIDVTSPFAVQGPAGRCHRYTLELLSSTGEVIASVRSGTVRVIPVRTGKKDVFRHSMFSRQRRLTWCVGASIQMMVNMVKRTKDHSYAGQSRYMRYARRHDRLRTLAGTDVYGWRATLNHALPGSGFRIKSNQRFVQAIRSAARRIRRTGLPVGLLVMRGHHAWVMSGFEATADPAFTKNFTVLGVRIEGPLYPRHNATGYDPPPDTLLTPTQLRRYMRPYDAPSSGLNGTFVTIQP